MSALHKDAKLRAGKGKVIISAVLGASLVAAVESREQQCTVESQMIQSLQDLVQSLQGQVKSLKDQLEAERTQANHLQSTLKEQVLVGKDSPRPPGKRIEYSYNELEEAKSRLDKSDVPTSFLRPLVKTEFKYEDDEDEFPQITTKEVPYSAIELAKLKKDFGRNPEESETEYVWRVSLSGGTRYC
ncbi:hypothetical protein GRJ2_003143600 [Grus japonensis]|uniref:Uncharacterized protein n=1 Tax=Grus japonensis TaxID=30415 RepID=A0ABC9Y9P9_GRUJA